MAIVDDFHRVRVLCVGDVMLDRFVLGTVSRISPESPVPVLSVQGIDSVPGGAANVARNVAALGGRCTLVGVIGDDAAGRELDVMIRATEGIASALVVAGDRRPTTEKVRYTAQGQHLLRTDQEKASAIDADTECRVLRMVDSQISSHDVLVLSDYAKGVLGDALVTGAIALARAHAVPVVVDPKSPAMQRYGGASVVTPNAKEAQAATGIDAGGDDGLAVQAAERILGETTIESVLVTRADKGMTLVSRGAPAVHLKASAREVFDVVGAGDTVVATLALGLGAGASCAEAAALANIAAGIVVGKRGTSTVTRSELVREQVHLECGHLAGLQQKILSRGEAVERVGSWRRDGLSIGFTNGCFDLLHIGHLSLLGFARERCGRLIVGLNTDASVRRLKGETRPLNGEVDRATVLAALSAVDAVVLFDEVTPLELIRDLAPNVIVKGGDYAVDDIVGADIVRNLGGQVLVCDLVPGRSTTALVSEIASGRQGASSSMVTTAVEN